MRERERVNVLTYISSLGTVQRTCQVRCIIRMAGERESGGQCTYIHQIFGNSQEDMPSVMYNMDGRKERDRQTDRDSHHLCGVTHKDMLSVMYNKDGCRERQRERDRERARINGLTYIRSVGTVQWICQVQCIIIMAGERERGGRESQRERRIESMDLHISALRGQSRGHAKCDV